MQEPLPGHPDEPLPAGNGGPSAEVVFFPARKDAATGPAGGGDAIVPAIPQPEAELVGVLLFRVLFRLVQLVAVLVYLGVAHLFDDLRPVGPKVDRRAVSVARRAVRLRRMLQRLGGTFVKIGQQLSIRADILPPAYCRELENLLDNTEEIPAPYVRAVLERQAGRRLEEVFVSPFDFDAIGKASIACVYRAQLLGGPRVAVKVRRPNIVRIFKTDLAALDWILRTAEFLTLLRPGVTANFRFELKLMLLEELDFRVETRYQELFRRYFKKRKKLRTTAPKLYFDLCGRDVIVSELVTGIWMKDLIAGLESGDPGFRRTLRALDIDPKKIAKRLIRGSHYGFFECPFFHGDPHPGNLLLQPGSRIVMVDFGACGVFAARERNQLAQMHYYQAREDIGGMVGCVISLMEPLPPIDLDSFRRTLEDAWWKGYYGVKSRHAEWWERTSFRLWSALLRLVRDYEIPLPLNVLRMIRATLLYDTVAARLYPKIDVFKEYRRYYDGYARRVRREIQRSIVRQLLWGLDDANYVRLARLWDVGNVLLQRVQLFLQQPLPSFSALISKGYELLIIGIKWLAMTSAATVAAVATGLALAFKGPKPASVWLYPGAFLGRTMEHLHEPTVHASDVVAAVWLVLVLLLTVKYLRQVWFRLSDRDVHGGR